jgi:hypothetical protein
LEISKELKLIEKYFENLIFVVYSIKHPLPDTVVVKWAGNRFWILIQLRRLIHSRGSTMDSPIYSKSV